MLEDHQLRFSQRLLHTQNCCLFFFGTLAETAPWIWRGVNFIDLRININSRITLPSYLWVAGSLFQYDGSLQRNSANNDEYLSGSRSSWRSNDCSPVLAVKGGIYEYLARLLFRFAKNDQADDVSSPNKARLVNFCLFFMTRGTVNDEGEVLLLEHQHDQEETAF